MRLLAALVISLLGLGPLAAATVSVVGGVTQIGSAGGVTGDVRSESFDQGLLFAANPAPSDLMAADGLTILGNGDPSPISGTISTPTMVEIFGVDFLSGNTVVEVDPGVNVTQFGLTVGSGSDQFVTVFDRNGALIGQANFEAGGGFASEFVGLDTGGTPIGWIAVSNDDLYNGAALSSAGTDPATDDWMWNYSAVPEPEEWALMILGGGGLLFWWWRRRRPVPVPV